MEDTQAAVSTDISAVRLTGVAQVRGAEKNTVAKLVLWRRVDGQICRG